jgi:murein DD-endopeptidase MepM/ murein hydrolase activator NlpD
MHVILVSDRMAISRTFTLSARHGIAMGAGLVGLVLLVSTLFSFMTLRHVEHIPLPFVQNILFGLRQQEALKTQSIVQVNLNAMASKLGEMQARIIRLDFLGERLSQLTGIKPQEVRDSVVPAPKSAQGGPLVLTSQSLTESDLQRQIDSLSQQVEWRGDYLGLVEGSVLDERIRQRLLPTALPIRGAWDSSTFGWRTDPITGQRAMHEGVDFTADIGTPITAAAAGVVITAERHAEYGNMIEIDHGDGLTTRYAHASRLLVNAGEVVKRGEKIAEVGSTGRSTGPHLHFEVRVDGVAKNPNRFLTAARDGASLAKLTK